MSVPETTVLSAIIDDSGDALQTCDAICDLLEEADLEFDRDEMASALEVLILRLGEKDPDLLATKLATVIRDRLW